MIGGVEEMNEPEAEPQPVHNSYNAVSLPKSKWQTLREKLINEDKPRLHLDTSWHPDQTQELVDMIMEDPDESPSMNRELEEHEELDFIMRVQGMPKGQLSSLTCY